MGDYADASDIRKQYTQVKTADLTDTDIDFFIIQAEAEINGRIAKAYDLPFSSTPAIIKSITIEFSVIKVLSRFFTHETDGKGKSWPQERREEIYKILEQIAAGEIILLDASDSIIAMKSEANSIYSDTYDYTPTFNHLAISQQKIDSDRLEDEL